MSDNTSGANQDPSTHSDDSGSNKDDSGTNSGGDSGTDAVPLEKFEKVEKANRWAQSKVKELESQLSDLQSKLQEKPKSKEDSKTLDNALAEIDSLKNSLSERDAKIHELQVKSAVQNEAEKHLVEGSFLDFWKIEGSGFVFDDDKGAVVPKEKPYQNLAEYFEEFAERKPYLMKSNRKPGTDDGRKAADKADPQRNSVLSIGRNASKQEVREHLRGLSAEERKAWLRKNG